MGLTLNYIFHIYYLYTAVRVSWFITDEEGTALETCKPHYCRLASAWIYIFMPEVVHLGVILFIINHFYGTALGWCTLFLSLLKLFGLRISPI